MKPIVKICFCVFIVIQCQIPDEKEMKNNNTISNPSVNQELGHGYEFKGNGKLDSEILDSLFTTSNIDSFPFPKLSQDFIEGLNQQLKLLKNNKPFQKKFGNLSISKKNLEETVKVLIASQFDNFFGIKKSLEAHQIWGEDKKGNVHFTGYFTPILKVRKQKDSIYQFPLYKYPSQWNGQLPTRFKIEEGGVLKNRNLEIAYGRNKLDIYTMQVQGSGIVEFENGERKLFAYSGSNKHPYRSIGKYMIEKGFTTKEKVSLKSIQYYFKRHPEQLDSILNINPSYIFFEPKDRLPQGAGNVPLTTKHSIAVDKDIIPLGTCLLGYVPILDNKRNFSHHEYRILIAQDVGGAIKGPGHIDLYMGVGKNAEFNASNLHHYGKLWVLLPKKSSKI